MSGTVDHHKGKRASEFSLYTCPGFWSHIIQVSRIQIVLGPQRTHMLRFQLSLCFRLLASASASLGASRAWQPLWLPHCSSPVQHSSRFLPTGPLGSTARTYAQGPHSRSFLNMGHPGEAVHCCPLPILPFASRNLHMFQPQTEVDSWTFSLDTISNLPAEWI